MKYKAIEKTTDMYQGYTPEQRQRMFFEERAIEKFKNQIRKAFDKSIK